MNSGGRRKEGRKGGLRGIQYADFVNQVCFTVDGF